MSTTIDTTSNGTQRAEGARSCHVMKWDNFDGYGFNLHAEKGKPGQYIGKVDEGSPAEAAGLRQGDKILEVDGIPIGDKTHKQVVELIKSRPNDTTMLVVDPIVTTSVVPSAAADATSKNSNGAAAIVTTSAVPSTAADATSKNSNGAAAIVTDSYNYQLDRELDHNYCAKRNGTAIINDVPSEKYDGENGAGNTAARTTDTTTVMLSFKNMTVAELRANLANRKKYDPKKEMMDFKKKFDIVQKL